MVDRPMRRLRLAVTPLAFIFFLFALPAASYQINTTSTGQNLHWSNFPVRYFLNAQGAPGVPGSLAAIRTAFQTWALVPGTQIQFTDGGTTGLATGSLDGTNLV